ncbi:protein PML-like isoform X2 [Narcine bancroftii]
MATEPGTSLMEYFHCGLCNSPLTSPKLLQCLHTFCASCLEREFKENEITCPICEMVTMEGFSSLQDNIFLSNLQNSLRKRQHIFANMELFCALCEGTTSAEFLCLECDKMLCNKCFHVHQMLMPDHKKKEHALSTLRKLNSDEFLKIVRRSKDLFCSIHDDQKINLYCSVCSKWLCVLCTILEHKEHNCITIQKHIAFQKSELQNTLAAIHTNQENFLGLQNKLEQLEDTANREKFKVEDLIKARVTAALHMVKEEESRLLRELEDLHHSKTQKIQESLTKTANVIKRMNVSSDVVSQLLRYATDQEILKLQALIKSGLDKLGDEKPTHMHMEYTVIDFQQSCVFPEKLLGRLKITKLKSESTSDGQSTSSSIAACDNKDVIETSKCDFNKRKCSIAEEAQTSKKQCLNKEPNTNAKEVSNASQSTSPYTESITILTESDSEEQSTVVELIQIDPEDSN